MLEHQGSHRIDKYVHTKYHWIEISKRISLRLDWKIFGNCVDVIDNKIQSCQQTTVCLPTVKADRVVHSKILKISKKNDYYWTSILQYYCTLTPDIFLTIYLSQVNLFPILSFYYNRETIVTFFALSTTRIWSQILYRISFLLPPVLNLNVFGVFNGRVDT